MLRSKYSLDICYKNFFASFFILKLNLIVMKMNNYIIYRLTIKIKINKVKL